MIERQRAYIDRRWVPCPGTGAVPVVDPTTEEPLGITPVAGPEVVDAAVAAARAAQSGWAATSRRERAALLRRVADGVRERTAELADLVTAELGSPLGISRRVHVGLAVADFAGAADVLDEPELAEEVGHSLVVREPVGVIGCITPWNFPLHQLAAKIAGALAAGCTVVAKPAEQTTGTAFLLAEILDAVGVPPGVVNLVPGDGPTTGEALVSHPGVDMVSFTGSTAAGRRVARLAAERVRPVALELGGKSPQVVLDDADLDAAVTDTVNRCFLNSGQVCSAFTRLIVPRARLREAEQIAERVAVMWRLGDPRDRTTRMGPVVSERQRSRVCEHIAQALEEGARLVTGGAAAPPGLERGWFVAPTVLSDVTPGMRVAREEVFGPVLVVQAHDGVDDAVRLADDCDYGLIAGVWARDPDGALAVARRLQVGQVDINGAPFNPAAPFGGRRLSGYGRELGRFGIEEFQVVKAIQRPPVVTG
ncbi:aldehyde dehydrogenase family protein [Amycolatopsis roodepoortensis]|uniref:aldehyde dehydrogenase family protein n=1 Tax=Amycolatopsis TaxID=1813 RepID=UPI000E27BD6A|nr:MULTISPECIES: aldehyde dehydrogenase family protein [Amycolatopsis]UUV32317.1 aldehyde dehydrogenase family protein [Amycolatopsis roodepoortensis]